MYKRARELAPAASLSRARTADMAMAMAPRFLVTLLAATVTAVLAGGQLGHAAPATAEVFWRAVLPGSPLPDAIVRPADTSFMEKVKGPFSYSAYGYKAPTKSHTGSFVEKDEVKSPSNPFHYTNYKAPSKSHAGSGPSEGASTARGGGAAATTTVFFHEEAARVGETLPFYFPPAETSTLGFLPRHVADSVPFTTHALPGILALFGIAPHSDVAAGMEDTLSACESPTPAGESMFCATSLEALVERSMAVLRTRDVSPLMSTLPRAGAPLQNYTVRAVRPVEGGRSFVACHDEAYPYTVYRCHTTGPARAYMVEMEGARGGGAVTVATVCHTDTSRWNPEHVSFKLLGTKPGGEPVCHLLPYGHIIWAKNVKRSPA